MYSCTFKSSVLYLMICPIFSTVNRLGATCESIYCTSMQALSFELGASFLLRVQDLPDLYLIYIYQILYVSCSSVVVEILTTMCWDGRCLCQNYPYQFLVSEGNSELDRPTIWISVRQCLLFPSPYKGAKVRYLSIASRWGVASLLV